MKKQQNCICLLYYHIVLTTKYRRKIIETYIDDIKQTIDEVASTSKFKVEQTESDHDHLHLLVEARSDISPSQIITRIKQQTTKDLWDNHAETLKLSFWKEHIFWNRGYFVASVGSVNKETIENYIINQKYDSSVTLKGSQDSRTRKS